MVNENVHLVYGGTRKKKSVKLHTVFRKNMYLENVNMWWTRK